MLAFVGGLGTVRLHSRRLSTVAAMDPTKPPHKSALDDMTTKGAFARKASVFRSWVSKGGEFEPEGGRYHLYVGYACPWAHRTIITRQLKGLTDAIGITFVDYFMGDMGWEFKPEPEPNYGLNKIRELYFKAREDYDGRFTIPVLWDKKTETIVNNESSEIIIMLNNEFNDFAKNPERDFLPESKRDAILEVAQSFYEPVNNGVYKCGFARTQEAYEQAFVPLFEKLDDLEEVLGKTRYLTGSEMTLADIRLFTTLVRFDAVYLTHFKCNKKRIIDYPNLFGFVCDMYQTPGVKDTVNMEHIKKHYFMSHVSINPFAIVPLGPDVNFEVEHDRATRF
ncbi:hypothetical protein NDN08_000668 [Rhodosorus marinus]|uniref:GST C-terminal domain-containing protein n=1 Tax=Rhodosorus marinus TaxID=101924 RepID=A0AAV8URP8_9RHOD|nr:hypothetical protein NDN08_000668 [Rhodosorus marinus]